MVLGNRLRGDGGVFHITHRCHAESLAVGSSSFVERIQPMILSRRETEIREAMEEVWVLKEESVPYGRKTRSKNACKA